MKKNLDEEGGNGECLRRTHRLRRGLCSSASKRDPMAKLLEQFGYQAIWKIGEECEQMLNLIDEFEIKKIIS